MKLPSLEERGGDVEDERKRAVKRAHGRCDFAHGGHAPFGFHVRLRFAAFWLEWALWECEWGATAGIPRDRDRGVLRFSRGGGLILVYPAF